MISSIIGMIVSAKALARFDFRGDIIMKKFISLLMVVSMLVSLSLHALVAAAPAITPTATLSMRGIREIAAGGSHSVVIRNDGTLWAWGSNTYGQLGDSTSTDRSTPVQVGTDTNWKSVSAGDFHTVALKTDGTMWAWGRNNDNQLGDNTDTQRNSPVQIGTGNTWTQVSAGSINNTALTDTGALYFWGANVTGWLNVTKTSVPTQVGTETGWRAVSSGGIWTTSTGYTEGPHNTAINSNNFILSWGWNASGQFGDGTTNSQATPVRLAAPAMGFMWDSVSAGGYHSVAIRSGGSLYTWGGASEGQLGTGQTSDSLQPVQVGSNTWTSASAGSYHTAAIDTSGTLWAWGDNRAGQVGDNTTGTNRTLPVQISSDTDWVAVDSGSFHNLAIKADGSLWAWGQNTSGQLGQGNTANAASPVLIAPVITITSQPSASTVVTEGKITQTLSAEAGETQNTPLSVQWYLNTTNTSFGGTPIAGATETEFALPADLAIGTHFFYAVFSVAGGATPSFGGTAPSAFDEASTVAVVNVERRPPKPMPVDLGSLEPGDWGPGTSPGWSYDENGVLSLDDGASIIVTGNIDDDLQILTSGTANVTVDGSLQIDDGGSLTLGPGVSMGAGSGSTITVSPGGSLTNNGTLNIGGGLNVGGGLDNNGQINIAGGGSLSVDSGGTVVNNPGAGIISGGDIHNDGNITSNGTLTINPPGKTSGAGTWTPAATTPRWAVAFSMSAHMFPTSVVGYDPTTFPASVRNNAVINAGNQATGGLVLTLSGTSAGSFRLKDAGGNVLTSPVSIPSLAPGARFNFSLEPIPGLAPPLGQSVLSITPGLAILQVAGSADAPMITPVSFQQIKFEVHSAPAVSIDTAPALYYGQGGPVSYNITALNFGTSPSPGFSPAITWTGAVPDVTNVVFSNVTNSGATLGMNVSPSANAGTYPFKITSAGSAAYAEGALVINQGRALRLMPGSISTPTSLTAFDARLATSTPSFVELAKLPSTVVVQLADGGTAVLNVGKWDIPGGVPYGLPTKGGTFTISATDLSDPTGNVASGIQEPITVKFTITPSVATLPVFGNANVLVDYAQSAPLGGQPLLDYLEETGQADVLPLSETVTFDGYPITFGIIWGPVGTTLSVNTPTSPPEAPPVTFTGTFNFQYGPDGIFPAWLTMPSPNTVTRTVSVSSCDHGITPEDPDGLFGAWYTPAGAEATCTAPGWRLRDCTQCHFQEREQIDPISHTPSGLVEIISPTCLNPGLMTNSCTVCLTQLDSETLPALGHEWPTAWMQLSPATCGSPGVEQQSCTHNCGVTQTRAISNEGLSHTFDSAHFRIILSPSCTQAGVEHEYCTVCGFVDSEDIIIPMLPHDFTGQIPVITPATCLVDGEEVTACILCGYLDIVTITAPGFHTWGTPVTRAATCTQTGFSSQTCSVCEETDTIIYPMLPHQWGEPIITSAPSCEVAGAQSQYCLNCTTLKTETLPALGHEWGEYIQTIAPTETAEGLETSTCSRCKQTMTRPVAALGTSPAKPEPDPDPDPDSGDPGDEPPGGGGGSGGSGNGGGGGSGGSGDDGSFYSPASPSAPGTTAPSGEQDTVSGENVTDGATAWHGGSPDRPSPDETFPFTDVDGHWAMTDGDIEFLWRRGIVRGITDTIFAPNEPVARAMLTTMLYRLDGEPEVDFADTFHDVSGGTWYSVPVTWAYISGIAEDAPSNLFEPGTNLSREQIVTMLFRYAQYKGIDTAVPDGLSTEFEDLGNVSGEALDAMHWAIHNGLIQGFEGRLSPEAAATRAEATAIMARFIRLIET